MKETGIWMEILDWLMFVVLVISSIALFSSNSVSEAKVFTVICFVTSLIYVFIRFELPDDPSV